MPTLSHNGNPVIYYINRDKIHKKHVYCVKLYMLTLSHNGNPVIHYNIQRQNTQKKLNNVWNQNVKVKKRARLATLAMIIVDNFCLYGTESKYDCRD